MIHLLVKSGKRFFILILFLIFLTCSCSKEYESRFYKTNIHTIKANQIFDAIKHGDMKVIQLLVENNIPLDFTNSNGKSPLVYAYEISQWEVFAQLCKHPQFDIHFASRRTGNRGNDFRLSSRQSKDPVTADPLLPLGWSGDDKYFAFGWIEKTPVKTCFIFTIQDLVTDEILFQDELIFIDESFSFDEERFPIPKTPGALRDFAFILFPAPLEEYKIIRVNTELQTFPLTRDDSRYTVMVVYSKFFDSFEVVAREELLGEKTIFSGPSLNHKTEVTGYLLNPGGERIAVVLYDKTSLYQVIGCHLSYGFARRKDSILVLQNRNATVKEREAAILALSKNDGNEVLSVLLEEVQAHSVLSAKAAAVLGEKGDPRAV